MKKVVITGIGLINSIGNNKEEVWDSILNNKCGIKEISKEMQERTGVTLAAEVNNYNGAEHFSKKEIRSYDYVTQLGIIAAREAAKDANLEQIEDRNKIGVNVTSGIGGMRTIQDEVLKASEKGFKKVSPMFIPKAIINLVSGNIAIELNAKGITNSLVTACASSTDAIGHAMMYIQNGMVDVMVTGGSETAANESGLAGFGNLRALSKATNPEESSMPFDKNRNGFIMGEGSAVLILESEEHALKRGAKIYGEIVSYGATCDGNHITAPDPEGIQGERAVKIALENAGLQPKDVNHVNCHGTSTVLNDQGEINFLRRLYGDDFKDTYINSFKGHVGHLLGAAGATEVALTIMSMNEGIIAPCLNTKEVAEECQGNIVINDVQKLKSKYAIKQSLGFGGHNSCLILKGKEDA